jgi:hypothetical protein
VSQKNEKSILLFHKKTINFRELSQQQSYEDEKTFFNPLSPFYIFNLGNELCGNTSTTSFQSQDSHEGKGQSSFQP